VAGIFIVEQTILVLDPETIGIAVIVTAVRAGRALCVDIILVDTTAFATTPSKGLEQTGHVGLMVLWWVVTRDGGFDFTMWRSGWWLGRWTACKPEWEAVRKNGAA
jgi:hypothetical protein